MITQVLYSYFAYNSLTRHSDKTVFDNANKLQRLS